MHQPPPSHPSQQALIADGLSPGTQLSKMLADILLDSTGLTTLDLSRNNMDDAAVAGIMEALGLNEEMRIQVGPAGWGFRGETVGGGGGLHAFCGEGGLRG